MRKRFDSGFSLHIAAAFLLLAMMGSAWGVPPGTWEQIGFDDQYMTNISIKSTSADTILVGTKGDEESGAYRTTDGGETWHMINDVIGNKNCLCLNGDPNNANKFVFLAENSNRIYLTTNCGDQWIIGTAGPAYNFLACAEFDRSNPLRLYAGGTNGLYRTTNGGGSFSFLDIGVADLVNSVAVDPSNNEIIYAGTQTNGLHKSTNDGVDWEKKSSGFGDEDCKVRFIRVHPVDSEIVYAACHWGGAPGTNAFYRSTDAGDNWAVLSPTQTIMNIFIPEDKPDVLIMATNNNGVVYSGNAGETFTEFLSGWGANPPWVDDCEPERQDLDMLWAATEDGIWRQEVNLFPGKPENVTWENKQEGILVHWDPVTLNEDGSTCEDLYGYVVRRNNLPGENYVIVDTLQYNGENPMLYDWADQEPTLEEGAAYRYQVQGMDTLTAVGVWSEWSSPGYYDPVGINVNLRGHSSENGIELSWTVREPACYVEYRLYRSASVESDYAMLASIPVHRNAHIDDSVVERETYLYRLGLVDENGKEAYSDPISVSVLPSAIAQLELGPNSPNPFNPHTTIQFAIPTGEDSYKVSLKVYDASGKLICNLMDGELSSGHHSIVWNGRDEVGNEVPTGTYFYVITCNEMRQMRKMFLVK